MRRGSPSLSRAARHEAPDGGAELLAPFATVASLGGLTR
jgi:hypothetical protein